MYRCIRGFSKAFVKIAVGCVFSATPYFVIAADVNLQTNEDSFVTFSPGGSFNIDQAVLAVTTTPNNGTAVVASPPTFGFTYTPNLNWYGTDTFRIGITEPGQPTVNQDVEVIVHPVNDPPVFDYSFYSPRPAYTGEPVTFYYGISDPDGDSVDVRLDPNDGSFVVPSMTHTYSAQGSYFAYLRAYDAKSPLVFNGIPVTVINRPVEINQYDWTWMGGSMFGEQPGVYGNLGVPANANTPGARYCSVSWSDALGNGWIFGGDGFDETGEAGGLSDLWKFNTVTNQWAFIKGSRTRSASGVYGIKGVAHADNSPGARVLASTWTDKQGNLWLFGGRGRDKDGNNGQLNDLWKFNILTNEWTWVNGSNTISPVTIHGAKGIAHADNTPGGRNSSTSWVDSDGNLWLFGGSTLATGLSGDVVNELWKYDIAAGNWTWIAGADTLHELGVYGTQGSAAAGNTPGARYRAAGWTGKDGKLWLFGGFSSVPDYHWYKYMNDVWVFDPSTNHWTWMKGTNVGNPDPVYGTKQVEDGTNTPGGTFSSQTWVDDDGCFWSYGGISYIKPGSFNNYSLHLWKYDPRTNNWTWMEGIPTGYGSGIYGTFGISNDRNYPGGRSLGVSWKDLTGRLWMFGGNGYTAKTNISNRFLNDVWMYDMSAGHSAVDDWQLW